MKWIKLMALKIGLEATGPGSRPKPDRLIPIHTTTHTCPYYFELLYMPTNGDGWVAKKQWSVGSSSARSKSPMQQGSWAHDINILHLFMK
jgi:hypothetical protein